MRMVEVDVYLVDETERAYVCATSEANVDADKFVYIPIGQVEDLSVRRATYKGLSFCVLTIPEWLAIKEGLV